MVRLMQKDNSIIIKLTNEDNKSVFMIYNYFQEKKKLNFVLMDLDTLKEYWRRLDHPEFNKYPLKTEQEIREDYKYEFVDEKFSLGVNDPVPVAQIYLKNTIPESIDVYDMTRTLWLFANGYKTIPVEVININSEFLLSEGIISIENMTELFINQF